MFEADQTAGTVRWQVIRVGVGSKTQIVLLSPRFFELTTHWNKCTVPCSGPECPLCELLPGRGLFYVACLCGGRVSLLELGAASASHFEQHCKFSSGGMLPGLVLDISRRSAKSPVYSEVVGKKETAKAVELFDLAAHVMSLYKFPCPNPGEDLNSYEERIQRMSALRNKRLRDQLTVASKR